MRAYDFEYDGIKLSEKGFILCKFDGSGTNTVSNGSQITFNKVPILNGTKQELVSCEYTNVLGTTLQICKNVCDSKSDLNITIDEERYLMSWLNRNGFHKFRFIHDDWNDIYVEASFNINKIENGGNVVGLELQLETNRPFVIAEEERYIYPLAGNGSFNIVSKSDDEGFVYPQIKIIVNNNCDLKITNSLDVEEMIIKNCISGEIITLDYPMVETSVSTHKIQNDFNWVFPKIVSTFRNKNNEYKTVGEFDIELSYNPVIKVGM